MTKHKSTLPLDRARIRALLFDVDGTLSDSDDHMVSRFASRLKFLDRLFKPGTAHRLARWFVHFAESPGNWLFQIADRLNLDRLLASFLDRRANQKEAELHNFPAIAGILPMLEILSERFPLAIVSARNEVTTRHFLRLNQLEEFFPVVVTSQTCPRSKPFADPLLFAAEQLGVPIENCLMIGDTVTDIRAAKAAGAQSLSVLCGFGLEKELRRAGTQEILASTSELAAYLTSTPL
jgi:haloacid dehalogenase superfamily, subfamily IA, variant 1 with third motif having Dx(3-4)D or Dx(3-4)E